MREDDFAAIDESEIFVFFADSDTGLGIVIGNPAVTVLLFEFALADEGEALAAT